jgi:Plasmid maintenance system antidote protein
VATIHLKVQEIIDERGWTQKKLAEITGLRRAAISELCNNMRTSINREHLERIAEALELKSINELMELRVEHEG